MTLPRVLVVEDNPITRKMIRFTLESGGYDVTEADEGRAALRLIRERPPQLVLQDLALPDMDGVDLLTEIRKDKAPADLPVLVLSGRTAKLESMREAGGSFDDFLTKPMEPSRLLEAVGKHLSAAPRAAEDEGRGRRILVVDDDSLNRKLAELRLTHAGFVVATAADGQAAIDAALWEPPHAILSDVLMPGGMDGFQLCQKVRANPALARIPVVLVSANYAQPEDVRLARRMGANALVSRSPDYREAIDSLLDVLSSRVPPPEAELGGEVERAYRQRVISQLERQVKLNEALTQRTALQAATLSVLSGLCDIVNRPRELADVLSETLLHCLDATGLSTGLLFLDGGDGAFRLEAHRGLSPDSVESASTGFGDPAALVRLFAVDAPVAFDFPTAPREALFALGGLHQTSLLVVPLVALGKRQGALVLASDSDVLSEAGWLGFARALSLQLGQAMALGRTMAALKAELEERRRADEKRER